MKWILKILRFLVFLIIGFSVPVILISLLSIPTFNKKGNFVKNQKLPFKTENLHLAKRILEPKIFSQKNDNVLQKKPPIVESMNGKCESQPIFSLETAKFLLSQSKESHSTLTNPPEIAILEDKFMDKLELPIEYRVESLNYTLMLGDCEYKYQKVMKNDKNYFYLGGSQTDHPRNEFGKGNKEWNQRKYHKQNNVINLLEIFHEWANSLGIVYQITAGTSLGLCRNGRPFRWDGDGDVFVSPESFKKIEILFNAYAHDFSTKKKRKVVKNFCLNESLIYEVSTIKSQNGISKYVFDVKKAIPYRKLRRFQTLCEFDTRKCMDFTWNGVEVKLTARTDENNKLYGVFFQFATLKKGKKMHNGLGYYDPESFSNIDIFLCKDVPCRYSENGIFKKLKSNLSCDEMKVKSMCQSYVLGNVLYSHGPFEGNTNEMFPEVKICGRKTRIDRLWFIDKERYCKIYSDSVYERRVGRDVNKSMKVKMENYLYLMEKYGKYGKYNTKRK